MKVFFVTTGLREEIEVIKKVKPPALLCSYWYFRNIAIRDLFDQLGYTPEILLDSGAYSAFTKGKSVSLIDYMAYIKANENEINQYISLDVIGDPYITKAYYNIMLGKGFSPIPVYHFGEDIETLRFYVERGSQVVALGNTVPIRDKGKVALWCDSLKKQFPDVIFHLLGSSSMKIIQSGVVDTCDSSAWYMQAVNGNPRTIGGKSKEAKIERAMYNMTEIMREAT